MPEQIEKKGSNWFLFLVGLCSLAVILASFYFFYFKKDFNFLVETACDPNREVCIERDCANPDDCPPNQLPIFKRYLVNAEDFQFCENEDCLSVCEAGIIECELLECVEDPEWGETCTTSIP